MNQSPLRVLVARHTCICIRGSNIRAPALTRSYAATSVRSNTSNIPSPLTTNYGPPDNLRRKARPVEPEEPTKAQLEYQELKRRKRNASYGILLCTLGIFGTVTLWPGGPLNKRPRKIDTLNEAPPSTTGLVGTGIDDNKASNQNQVETVETGTSSVPLFPKTISMSELDAGSSTSLPAATGDQEYQLVGLGIRTVSFLSIQVYVVGMYVAVSDIAKLHERLIRTQDSVATTLVADEKHRLRDALLDGDRSEDIWNAVLEGNGIRSVFRIVPTRNTDFGHLRDGFIRQVTAKVQHFSGRRNDQSFGDERFGESMQAFKGLFAAAPRKNLPKGEVLLLGRDAKGVLGAWYEDPNGMRTRFGRIEDERISRLVWLQYLSGKSPSSEGARKSIVDGVMEFVERPVGTVATQVV